MAGRARNLFLTLLLLLYAFSLPCLAEDMLKVSVEVDGVRRQLPLSHAQCTSMVEAFTNYHLHFRTEQIYDTLVCYPNDAHNLTFAVLEDVRVCPERRYRPRRLERAQVSWKPVANKTDKANKGVDSSEHKDQQAAEDKGRRTHDFLAFGLFLPEHPYSSELTAVLTAIGPMFPALAIVCGNGYEFRDMVQKYFVHSFPTLLLFKEGVYVGDYEGDHSPAALAAHFSLWTGQLPQTHPLVVPAPAALPSTALLPISWLGRVRLPYANLEPFLGSVLDYAFWDGSLFLLCGMYCALRLLHTVSTSLRPQVV